MVHTVVSLCLACLIGPSPMSLADRDVRLRDPRVRAIDPILSAAIHAAAADSATFRRIVGEIEQSDVVVYVVFERQRLAGVAAHLAFITAAGGRRYVHVAVDPSVRGRHLLAVLGHELQHAAEVAGDRSVVDNRSFAALYGRIGVSCRDRGWDQQFDTAAAVAAEADIHRELRLAAQEEAKQVRALRRDQSQTRGEDRTRAISLPQK